MNAFNAGQPVTYRGRHFMYVTTDPSGRIILKDDEGGFLSAVASQVHG